MTNDEKDLKAREALIKELYKKIRQSVECGNNEYWKPTHDHNENLRIWKLAGCIGDRPVKKVHGKSVIDCIADSLTSLFIEQQATIDTLTSLAQNAESVMDTNRVMGQRMKELEDGCTELLDLFRTNVDWLVSTAKTFEQLNDSGISIISSDAYHNFIWAAQEGFLARYQDQFQALADKKEEGDE